MKRLWKACLWFLSGHNFRWAVRYTCKNSYDTQRAYSEFRHEEKAREHFNFWKGDTEYLKTVELLDRGQVIETRVLTNLDK